MKRILLLAAIVVLGPALTPRAAVAQKSECTWAANCTYQYYQGSWRHKFVSQETTLHECNCESCCHGSWDTNVCSF